MEASHDVHRLHCPSEFERDELNPPESCESCTGYEECPNSTAGNGSVLLWPLFAVVALYIACAVAEALIWGGR